MVRFTELPLSVQLYFGFVKKCWLVKEVKNKFVHVVLFFGRSVLTRD